MRRLSLGESVIYGLGNMGANVVYGFLNFAGPLYLGRYPEVPAWAVGFIVQERSFAGSFVQPIVGALSDRTRTRFGRRRPFFVVGVGLTTAALLFLAGYPPLVPMLLVLSVNALFLNVALDPYMALMADMVPMDQRGRIGTVLAIAGMIGQVAVIVLGTFLWDRSPQLVFFVSAAILVATWAATTIGVHEPPPPPRAAAPVRLRPVRYVRGILAERDLSRYVLAAGIFWLGTGGVQPFLTRFGVNVLGMSEGETFSLILPLLVGTVVTAVPAGYLADRFGKKPFVVGAMLFLAAVALVGSQVRTVPQALVVMACVGAANGFLTTLLVPFLVDFVPRDRAAELTGLGSGVWSFAQPIGAVIAGTLIDVTGDYRMSFVGAGVLILTSFLVLLGVHAPRPAAAPLAAASH